MNRNDHWLVILVVISAIAGCAPISESTDIREELIGTELRQNIVERQLDYEVSLIGDRPDTNGALVVEVRDELICEGQHVSHYRQTEVTTRRIGDWSYPLAFLLGTAIFSFCAGAHEFGSGCISEDEDGEPLSDGEHRGFAVMFGVSAGISAAIVMIDLLRARNSRKRLEDRSDLSAPQVAYCGTEPVSGALVEFHWGRSDGPQWSGRTDSSGQVVMGYRELNWFDDSNGELGELSVEGQPISHGLQTPDHWVEARQEYLVERLLEEARQAQSASVWLDVAQELSGHPKQVDALQHFIVMARTELASGQWSIIDSGYERARHLAPGEQREMVEGLFMERLLMEARQEPFEGESSALGGRLQLYSEAIAIAPSRGLEGELRQEAYELGMAAVQTFVEGLPESAAKLMEILDALEPMAGNDRQRDQLIQVKSRAEQKVFDARLAYFEQALEQHELSDVELRLAYGELLEDWRGEKGQRYEAMRQHYVELMAQTLEEAVRRIDIRQVERQIRQLAATTEVTEEELREAALTMFYAEVRHRYGRGDFDGAERLARRLVGTYQHEDLKLILMESRLQGVGDLLASDRISITADMVEEIRGLVSAFAGQLNGDSQAAEVVDEQSRRIRRILRREIALTQINNLDDAQWLYPADIRSPAQIANMFGQPDRYVGSQAYVSFRVIRSIGNDQYLVDIIHSGQQAVAISNQLRIGRTYQARVEVTGSVADNRQQGQDSLATIRVAWTP